MTDLALLGWSPTGPPISHGVPAPRVTRVDRGRLTVLGSDGEARVHPGAALYDDAVLAGPAVGDWVALRGELAVAVLPGPRVHPHVAGRSSAAQVVAANLDMVLVVDSLAAETRLRRVERASRWPGAAARRRSSS